MFRRNQRKLCIVLSLVVFSFIYYSLDARITENLTAKKVEQIRSISWKPVTAKEKFSEHRSNHSIKEITSTLQDNPQKASNMVTQLSYRSTVYDIRKSTLKRACENVTFEDVKEDELFENLFVDQRHKLIFCQIQKVGSTFIHQMLGMLNQNKAGTVPKLNKDKKGLVQIISFLSNFKKFMFVREPYGRMMSGYVDKIFAPNPVFWSIGRSVISRTRTNASEESKKCGNDATFPEFIRYVIQSEEKRKYLDPHFTPMHRHCSPCHINYDFIGKVETMKADALYLFETLNKQFNTNISFNDFVTDWDLTMTKGHTKRMFGMKKNIIKCMPFYKAMLRTWRDLQIRGMLPIDVDLPFTEKESENITASEYYEAAKRVIEVVKDRSAMKRQREESLIEAYSLLTLDEKDRLQKILETDCKMFGYDAKPPKLFDVKPGSIKLKYFNLFSQK